MKIKESAENYLECILMLREECGGVRSIDVAKRMGVTKASVSVAMKSLRADGYITVSENGELHLTDRGKAVAARIYERHQIIAEVLMKLGASRENAFADSCKIEHDISDESFQCIKAFLNTSK